MTGFERWGLPEASPQPVVPPSRPHNAPDWMVLTSPRFRPSHCHVDYRTEETQAERKERVRLRDEHRAEVKFAKEAALVEKRRIAARNWDMNTRMRIERSERLRIERGIRNRSNQTPEERHAMRVEAGKRARATYEARKLA